MQSASPYLQTFIRDAFLQGSVQVCSYIQEILNTTSSSNLKRFCLDILSRRTYPIHSEVLKKWPSSEDESLRLAAITLHAHNPQSDSEKFLIKALSDSSSSIRKEACHGLRIFPSEENCKRLQKSLLDDDLSVRLEAAGSLFRIGAKGQKILLEELHSSDVRKKQVASYVLHVKQGIR